MIAGDVITILKPVCPQKTGLALVNKVENFGELRFEVEQGGTKQWYKEDQICEYEPNQDTQAWKESLKLCDQYKEAISEATEDLKESAVSSIHSTDAIDYHLAELFKKQSTSTTFTKRSPNNEINIGVDIGSKDSQDALAYVLYSKGIKGGTSAERLIKKALALLAEQKQNELKEIEELIKKL